MYANSKYPVTPSDSASTTSNTMKSKKLLYGICASLIIICVALLYQNHILNDELDISVQKNIIEIGITDNLNSGWFGSERIKIVNTTKDTSFVYVNDTCVKIQYLLKYHYYNEVETTNQAILIHVVPKETCITKYGKLT